MSATFLRIAGAEDKAAVLRLLCARSEDRRDLKFDVDVSAFRDIPGSPFAYWASDRLRLLFHEFPRFESNGREAKQGLATTDDFRFVRASWAVRPSGDRWFPFAKG